MEFEFGGKVLERALTGQVTAEKPSPQRNGHRSVLLRKAATTWRVGRCWLRYLAAGSRAGAPELVDFVIGNRFFCAWQFRSELLALGELIGPLRPKCLLEVGTASGGTLFFWTRLADPAATIVSIDLPGGKYGGGYSEKRAWLYRRFPRRNQRLHLLRGDSHSPTMLERAKIALEGQPLDYLFVDGDHTYDGVKSDFSLYAPLVRKGGMIAFHDIQDNSRDNVGVPAFWNQIKTGYRHHEFIESRTQSGYGIGVLHID